MSQTIGRQVSVDRRHLRTVSVVRSEWIKLRTVRSTMWTLLAMVVISVGVSALAALAVSSRWNSLPLARRLSFDPTGVSLRGLLLSQLVIGVLGVLVMSAEYGTGTIRATLSAVPHRSLVLTTKATVFAAVGLVVGELLSFVAFLLGQSLLKSPAPHATLGQPGVLRAVVGGGLVIAVMGIFALGLATIIRHSAGAITTYVGTLLILPLLVAALPSSMSTPINKFLPFNIGHAMTAVTRGANSISLSPWTGFAVLCAYALGALLVGGILMLRRDA